MPFVGSLDSTNGNLKIPSGSVDPGSGSVGQLFYNTTENLLKVYLTDGWFPLVENLYELDDIFPDGVENTFQPTLNYTKVNISDPFKLSIYIDGVIQNCYLHNKEYVYNTSFLDTRKNYTIDHDGNIKFTKSVPLGSKVIIKTISGNNNNTIKRYPFSPTDIML